MERSLKWFTLLKFILFRFEKTNTHTYIYILSFRKKEISQFFGHKKIQCFCGILPYQCFRRVYVICSLFFTDIRQTHFLNASFTMQRSPKSTTQLLVKMPPCYVRRNGDESWCATSDGHDSYMRHPLNKQLH